MKSRTLSCKKTFFLKNLTRFLPFWALYTLCLLLGLVIINGREDRFYFIMNLGSCARMMAWVNCAYALLTAQLLFGDLYDSRMCSGIHSLPIRREEIFLLNVGSGLLFSLVPTLVMTLCALPLALSSTVPHAGQVPLLWFAAANLQYLFFFALAVFCVFLAGNRLSMAVLYGILNFGSLLLYLLIDSVYMPLLLGVDTPFDGFYMLCPVAKISTDLLLQVERKNDLVPGTFEIQGGSWVYLLICAGIGLLLLLLALQMYRKRSLETAGDFMAFKALKPVFLVLFSICAGTGLDLVFQIFLGLRVGDPLGLLFGAVGLIAGWFVGLMLLEKTARVFNRRSFAGIGLLTLFMAGSLLITRMDVLGIASWVPEPSQVEKVYVIPGYENFGDYWTNREKFALESQEDLESVKVMHTQAIREHRIEPRYWTYPSDPSPEQERQDYTVGMSLEYHMKDGTLRRRYYHVSAAGEAGKHLKRFSSREISLLEHPEILDSEKAADWIAVGGISVPEKYLTKEDTGALLDAIRQDCREGSLAPQVEFHRIPVLLEGNTYIPYLDLNLQIKEDGSSWNYGSLYITIYSDSLHTLQWIRQRGLMDAVIKGYQ